MTINQAIGGLIVALVLVYLGKFQLMFHFFHLLIHIDSVTRSFAGSFSFILCTIFSTLFMGFTIHSPFLFGALIIIMSTYAYSVPDDMPMCSTLRGISQQKSEV